MSFNNRQKKEFESIETLLDIINTDKKNFENNIKTLSKKENEIKAVLSFDEDYATHEITYCENLKLKVEYILDPVFEKIIDSAFKHYIQWFEDVNNFDDKGISLTPTQMKMVYWMMYKIIRKKSMDDIYTVVMPRGGGKSFIIASLAVFFSYFHNEYCINKKDDKYSILITSPSDNNLSQFLSYIRDFVDKANQRTTTNISVSRNNDELIRLKNNDILFSEIYFRLAGKTAKNIEGVHVDLLLGDEFKMVEKASWDTSILPCLNGKNGLPVCISSTDEFYTFFQSLCEENIRLENIDGEKRHFQGNVTKLAKERPEYALSVSRAKKQLGEHSIAYRTQYGCEFIGKKKQGFFNYEALDDIGVFKNYYNNIDLFLNNPKYVLILGWDYAPIHDNSMLTIKALEEESGTLRKLHFVRQVVLNQSRDVQIDTIKEQVRRTIDVIKEYNIQAIALDATGAGANLRNILIDELLEREDVDIDFNKIIEVKFCLQNRIDILDNYSNRLNSGVEILFEIPEYIRNSENLKRMYNYVENNFDDESEVIRFLYEHNRFNRTSEILKSGKKNIIYKQAAEYKLKDDTIFSSALATHLLTLFPKLSYIENNIGNVDFLSTSNSNIGFY